MTYLNRPTPVTSATVTTTSQLLLETTLSLLLWCMPLFYTCDHGKAASEQNTHTYMEVHIHIHETNASVSEDYSCSYCWASLVNQPEQKPPGNKCDWLAVCVAGECLIGCWQFRHDLMHEWVCESAGAGRAYVCCVCVSFHVAMVTYVAVVPSSILCKVVNTLDHVCICTLVIATPGMRAKTLSIN